MILGSIRFSFRIETKTGFSFTAIIEWPRFGVSDSTVFHCVNEVCLILYEGLQSVIIRWPKGEYAERVMEGFREKQRIGYWLNFMHATLIFQHCHFSPEHYALSHFLTFSVLFPQFNNTCT